MQTLNEAGVLPSINLFPGVNVRVVEGIHLTMAIAELDPDITVPEHRHHNEQLGVVAEGSATFIVDGQARELTAGGTYRLLSDVPHEVRVGPAGAVFIECFSPIRDDWHALAPNPGLSHRWPRGR